MYSIDALYAICGRTRRGERPWWHLVEYDEGDMPEWGDPDVLVGPLCPDCKKKAEADPTWLGCARYFAADYIKTPVYSDGPDWAGDKEE